MEEKDPYLHSPTSFLGVVKYTVINKESEEEDNGHKDDSSN